MIDLISIFEWERVWLQRQSVLPFETIIFLHSGEEEKKKFSIQSSEIEKKKIAQTLTPHRIENNNNTETRSNCIKNI